MPSDNENERDMRVMLAALVAAGLVAAAASDATEDGIARDALAIVDAIRKRADQPTSQEGPK